MQNKLFGGLGGIVGGQACTVQLEFKRTDGQAVKTVAVKGKKDEVETLPLFTNKDSITGEVRSAGLTAIAHASGVRRHLGVRGEGAEVGRPRGSVP